MSDGSAHSVLPDHEIRSKTLEVTKRKTLWTHILWVQRVFFRFYFARNLAKHGFSCLYKGQK